MKGGVSRAVVVPNTIPPSSNQYTPRGRDGSGLRGRKEERESEREGERVKDKAKSKEREIK